MKEIDGRRIAEAALENLCCGPRCTDFRCPQQGQTANTICSTSVTRLSWEWEGGRDREKRKRETRASPGDETLLTIASGVVGSVVLAAGLR